VVQPVTRSARRPGVTLIELLVVLALVMVLVAIAGASTQRLLAIQSQAASADTRRSALSDALRTLTRHVASAESSRGDLRSAQDTVLELLHGIGSTTVCNARGDTLVVTNSADSMPWRTTLPRAVTDDDALRIWHDGDARWITRRVRTTAPATGPCGDGSLPWPDRATQQLVLDGTTSGMRPGAVVRVLQHERWSLVRGGDGNWSLTLATWDASRHAFNPPQPLLSPLSPPSAGSGAGLVVRAIDALGNPLPDSALGQARSVIVVLRYRPTGRQGVITDSVRVDVGTD
jgi:prepilin-type N-terminal cleavage/methylation domain-containing protein